MDYLLLYFIVKLDTICSVVKHASLGFAVLFVIVIGVYITFYTDRKADMESFNFIRPWVKRLGICFGVALFLFTTVPNTTQMAVIYCLPKIVNNEQVQKIPNKVLDLANNWIDETIKKTTETVDKTVTK